MYEPLDDFQDDAMEYEDEDDEQNPNNNNLQYIAKWRQLKGQLDLIYDEDPCVNSTFLLNCYNSVFDYVMQGTREQIQLRNSGQQEFQPGRNHEISRELYLYLIGYMIDKTNTFAEIFNVVQPDEIFHLYSNEWTRYKRIHKKMQFVFSYLDRHFVPTERKNRNVREIQEVYKFSMVKWHEIVFSACQSHLVQNIIRFMRYEREGREIDKEKVSNASKSFIELGTIIDDQPLKYYEALEEEYIKATGDFYRDKSRKLMFELNLAKTMTFSNLMTEIYKIFDDEKHRVEFYLDESSVKKVIRVCEECLIKDHKERFSVAFMNYLQSGDNEKISKIYDLIIRFPDQMEGFVATFKAHVLKEGDDSVAKLENVLKVDPKAYIETILTTYSKYETMVDQALKKDETFAQAVKDATKIFLNNNVVTHASKFDDRNAELLAKYCDCILTKGNGPVLTEEELEAKLKYVMAIFMLLNDKDGFQKFYENITAQRLIYDTTVSKDAEEFMIQELKSIFGEQDSGALKDITQNLKISADINKEFKAIIEKENDPKVLKNFTVALLSERSWPYSSNSPYSTTKQFMEILPTVLEPTINRFNDFYISKFTGVKKPKNRKTDNLSRKLQWMHNLGKGELNAQFLGKNYIIQTGAFQMAVLMQFNKKNSYTFEELKRNTGIVSAPSEFLQQTLQKLFEVKLLICKSDDYAELKSTSEIVLNVDFKSNRARINVDQPLDAEVEINRKEVMKFIDSDRELLTQCAIVRIMKREKRLHQTDIIAKVITELTKRFKPEIEMIKRSLQLSIGKDFIAADPKEKLFYVYIE